MKERPGAQLCNSSAALVYRKACATSSPSSAQALQAWGWGGVGFPSGPSGRPVWEDEKAGVAVSLANSGPHPSAPPLAPLASVLTHPLC